MHISDQVAAELIEQGYDMRQGVGGDTSSKTIEGFAEAGTISNGRRVVRLVLDAGGRWFERHDGWGMVERDVDLRNFDDAKTAIRAVLA